MALKNLFDNYKEFEVQNIYDLIELHKNNFYEYGG